MSTQVSVGGTVEHMANDLAALVEQQGARWRARTSDDRPSDSYTAGVLHGLCIALAVVTGRNSDDLLHEQMSGEPPRERKVGEVRMVHEGSNRVGGGRWIVEQWTGEKWERQS